MGRSAFLIGKATMKRRLALALLFALLTTWFVGCSEEPAPAPKTTLPKGEFDRDKPKPAPGGTAPAPKTTLPKGEFDRDKP